MASAAGVGTVGVFNKVSSHPDSPVCVPIFVLLSAGPAIRRDVPARSASRPAGQTCGIADFQVGKVLENARPAGLETRDTADLEVGVTVAVPDAPPIAPARIFSLKCLPHWMEYQRENGFALNRRVRHENN
jgi:hypothetical protein